MKWDGSVAKGETAYD